MSTKIVQSISNYYPLALAEQEGAGTAYEYFMKARVLTDWFSTRIDPVRSMVIGGLPEKYGFSGDFLLLAQLLHIEELTVIDDRQERLDAFQKVFDTLVAEQVLYDRTLKLVKVEKFTDFTREVKADLFISCEVLQRLDDKVAYIKTALASSLDTVIFTPNGSNSSHAGLSGLRSVKLAELENFFTQAGGFKTASGYIDMPPFPPGISRSEDQREQAEEGLFEQVAFKGFEWWGKSERFFPLSLKKKHAHIVYIAT